MSTDFSATIAQSITLDGREALQQAKCYPEWVQEDVSLLQDQGLKTCVLEGKVIAVDEDEELALYHYTSQWKNDPLASHYRGWIVEKSTGKVLVKAEADFSEHVVQTQEELEAINEHSEGLYKSRQVTNIRVFQHAGYVYSSTHMRLDAYESHWGIYGNSFGDMLDQCLYPGELVGLALDPTQYTANGCVELLLEAVDNQFIQVVKSASPNTWDDEDGVSVESVTENRVYFLADYYSEEVNVKEYNVALDDFCFVDPVIGVKYLSPSMHNKLNVVRNVCEPNIVKRFFYLKGQGQKLIDILPPDQKQWLSSISSCRNQMVHLAAKKGLFRPASGNLIQSFNKLPGIEQYNIVAQVIPNLFSSVSC